MLDFRLLLQFAAVAENLSFTQAAARLGIGQPRLSALIRKLEEQLGVTLFERSTRRVELSARGRELLEIVTPLAQAANQTQARLANWREEVGGLVRIGCPQLGAPDPMQARLFSRFLEDYPGLELDVHPGLSAHHLGQLRAGDIEFALMSDPPRGLEWEQLPLYRLALAAVMHAADPLARFDRLGAANLAGRHLAVFARRRAPELHDRLYAALAAAGAELIEVPELRRSVLRDRADLILSTIVAAPAEGSLPHDLVRREITVPAEMRMVLVRLRAAVHPHAATRFWASASRFAAELGTD